MSEEFRKCLKLERDRARSRRESAQGSFEFAMLSLDQHVESFDDPGKIAMFSDGGAEAERVYSYDESVDGSYYTRRIKAARRRLSRNCPELVEVFNLVVKNGKTAMKASPNWHCATTLKTRSQRCATGVT